MSDTIKSKHLEGTRLIVETKYGTKTYDSRFLVAAFLIFIARGKGRIEPEESAKMIDLIEAHFQMQGAESLELLTRVMSDMAENPELAQALTDLVYDLFIGGIDKLGRHCPDGAQGYRGRRPSRNR